MLSNFRCLSYNKLHIIRFKISFKSIIQNNFTDISLLLLVLYMQKCWRIWKLDKRKKNVTNHNVRRPESIIFLLKQFVISIKLIRTLMNAKWTKRTVVQFHKFQTILFKTPSVEGLSELALTNLSST